MRRILALGITFVLFTSLAAQAQYTVIATTSSQDGSLVRSEWAVQGGTDPLATFRMIRLHRDVPPRRLRAAILFLPSLGSPFALYEQRDTSGARGTSIAEFFALRGYDVYGYTPRYQNLPSGVCEAGVLNCSGMADWDLQSMVEDLTFIRSRIEELRPGTPVVAGGTSLGGMLAFALADAHPEDYAGIFPWEGMLESPDPVVQALNQGYCAAVEAQLAAGITFDAVGGSVLRRVVEHSATSPHGLNTIPFFPPFLTRHQAMVAAVSQEAPGPVSMPVPGYIAMAGDLAQDRLSFADERRLYDNVRTFANYVPNAVVRDVSCSLAGIETRYTDGLGAF
ncbi:MAG: hypothetical protein KDD47_20050, partial [Acidobacteria bacterium]|nr:hypothetical protein [Acidobacteriota bacterium]